MNSASIPATLYIERFVLKDKKSMFRASEPDQHICRIVARTKLREVVLVEHAFATRKQAEDWNYWARLSLGLKVKEIAA